MKFLQALLFVWAYGSTTTNAFQLTTMGRSTTTNLFANSKNIRAAMEATEMYGPTSPEARLAWETVEEFDARDNTAAYEGKNEYQWTDQDIEQANAEIYASLQMIQQRTEKLVYNQSQMKDVVAELQAIKLSPPEKKPAPQIPGLWDAKLKARAISQQYGNTSAEARLAWEEVEEIASAGLENAMGEDMTQQCLVEAAEACLALEELSRFLYYEHETNNQEGQYYY